MRVLLDKTGRGQLEILSIMASEPGLKQKDIVSKSSLSKGAVSNNVRKLKEKDLVTDVNKLELNMDRLLQIYREHVEIFLIRESSEPEELNNARTYVKKNFSDIISGEDVSKLLRQVLALASDREDLESLNSVFKETDRILYETAEGRSRMIGIVTDKSNTVKDNPEIAEEAQKILDEVKE